MTKFTSSILLLGEDPILTLIQISMHAFYR
jgi:hypothetical protein